MKPFRAAFLVTCVALIFPAGSNAQAPPNDGLRFIFGLTVADRPYSVVWEIEATGRALDGSRIIQKHQTRLFRDSAGRMRFETFPLTDLNRPQNTPETVSIFDPTARVMYTLTPSEHVAQSTSMPPSSPPDFSIPPPTNNLDDIDQYVLARRAPYSKTASEDLGTQMMEGLLVRGERTTWTLPAGSEGMNRPITEVDEVWTAPDLDLALISRHSDSGGDWTATHALSVNRFEPDPTLFKVPPDYIMQDTSAK